MPCYICGRSNCEGWFHSGDEQRAFERAEDAYRQFIEVQKECRDEYNQEVESDEKSG